MFTRAKAQSAELPRRFYAQAAAAPVDGGFGVLLDGRQARTPDGRPLTLPTEALARLVAQEWEDQGEHIVLADMPATRLAHTALDRVHAAHDAVADEAARYLGSDVVCYFAEGPASLVERQMARWRPLLGWAFETLGLHLVRATGLVHQPQPEASLAWARQLARALDDLRLTGLAHAAGLFGSTVLAFALERGRLGGEEALELSRLDEAFQEERWGVDAEAAERTERMRREAVALDRWFRALG